jgi:hypothetical protein
VPLTLQMHLYPAITAQQLPYAALKRLIGVFLFLVFLCLRGAYSLALHSTSYAASYYCISTDIWNQQEAEK